MYGTLQIGDVDKWFWNSGSGMEGEYKSVLP